jgi:hypothetical protein
MDQDLVKHGPVQILASMGHVPTYDDYANEMSRDCKYRTLGFHCKLVASVAGTKPIVAMLAMCIH